MADQSDTPHIELPLVDPDDLRDLWFIVSIVLFFFSFLSFLI